MWFTPWMWSTMKEDTLSVKAEAEREQDRAVLTVCYFQGIWSCNLRLEQSSASEFVQGSLQMKMYLGICLRFCPLSDESTCMECSFSPSCRCWSTETWSSKQILKRNSHACVVPEHVRLQVKQTRGRNALAAKSSSCWCQIWNLNASTHDDNPSCCNHCHPGDSLSKIYLKKNQKQLDQPLNSMESAWSKNAAILYI